MLSVPWSLLLMTSDLTDPFFVALLLFPWIAGPIVFYACRFVFRGTLRPPTLD